MAEMSPAAKLLANKFKSNYYKKFSTISDWGKNVEDNVALPIATTASRFFTAPVEIPRGIALGLNWGANKFGAYDSPEDYARVKKAINESADNLLPDYFNWLRDNNPKAAFVGDVLAPTGLAYTLSKAAAVPLAKGEDIITAMGKWATRNPKKFATGIGATKAATDEIVEEQY